MYSTCLKILKVMADVNLTKCRSAAFPKNSDAAGSVDKVECGEDISNSSPKTLSPTTQHQDIVLWGVPKLLLHLTHPTKPDF